MHNSIYSKIVSISFIILLFFIFFGTAIPFRPRIEDVDQVSSSNIVNQVLYSSLFIISVIVLIPKKDELFTILKTEKFLSIFIIFSFLSIAWSEYGFITFKRIFQVSTMVLSILAFLLYVDSSKEVLKHFKYVLYPYLVLTLVVVFVVPGAIDPQFHTWRGFTSHKNTLGQISLISTILCYIIYKTEGTTFGKYIAIFMGIIAVTLLFGAYSSTAILTFLFLIGLSLFLSVDKFFKPIGIGRTISTILIISFFLIVISILYFIPEFEKVIPALFGKDTTFSGRTDLWEYLISEIRVNPIIGIGYQAFWVPESRDILFLYKSFVWLPNEAHNGYLDIYLQLGIAGLSLILMMLIKYFIILFKVIKPHPWVWFIIITIIINFQESTILRPIRTIDFIFIFSYLIVFVNYYKPFIWQTNNVANE